MTEKELKYSDLVLQIQQVVQQNRLKVTRSVSTIVTNTYWQIGKYIVEFEQNGNKRAEYGKGLLKKLSNELTKQLGKGFSHRNLRLFRQFYSTFPIWQSLIAKSEKALEPVEKALISCSWTHLVRLLSINNEDERNFYLIELLKNNWSVRELNRQINTSLFERLLLSEKRHEIKRNTDEKIMPTEVLKDPYILDFLGFEERADFSENDLETAIINNLEKFLLELGKGFSFVARQYRISSGAEHFYIDLVFYNRLLQSHVLIDLKIGKLKHQDIGQMQMYVNYFDREIRVDFENPTIGIILCKEKNDFVVEYSLPKDNKQIYPKEYLLYLPDKEELQKLLKKYM